MRQGPEPGQSFPSIRTAIWRSITGLAKHSSGTTYTSAGARNRMETPVLERTAQAVNPETLSGVRQSARMLFVVALDKPIQEPASTDRTYYDE